MSYYIVFPGWYPNKYREYDGDFIQRHLRATSSKVQLNIFFQERTLIENSVTVQPLLNKGEEKIKYYTSKNSLTSTLAYIKECKNFINTNKVKFGKPNAIHFCIATNKNIIAAFYFLIFTKYKIYYSEHSTDFIDGSFFKKNWVLKKITYFVFKKFDKVTVVSTKLKQILKDNYNLNNCSIISNLLDQDIFFYNESQPNIVTQFIHVSGLNYQKNVEGMLQAFALLPKNLNYTLHIVGGKPAPLVDLAINLKINENIIWHNLLSQIELGNLMRRCDALVHFARFESFGCVYIEAMACGLPVITTDYEVHTELINEQNGVIVQNENINDLKNKLEGFINKEYTFDRKNISKITIEKFSKEVIGKQMYEWYIS